MATVTCRTEGCSNEGVGITISTTYVDDDGNSQSVDAVQCGVCGQRIEDVE